MPIVLYESNSLRWRKNLTSPVVSDEAAYLIKAGILDPYDYETKDKNWRFFCFQTPKLTWTLYVNSRDRAKQEYVGLLNFNTVNDLCDIIRKDYRQYYQC